MVHTIAILSEVRFRVLVHRQRRQAEERAVARAERDRETEAVAEEPGGISEEKRRKVKAILNVRHCSKKQ